MTPDGVARVERGGWSLMLAPALTGLPARLGWEVVERALRIAAGAGGAPLRRSRHAATYHVRLGAALSGEAEVFIKLLDAPGRVKAMREMLRGPRAERMRAIIEALAAGGFSVAPLLMLGQERAGGRTLIATTRVMGEPLPRALRKGTDASGRRRALLNALGAEVARLHRAGFIHGDLTPYNVFVIDGAPERFCFIDHERTAQPRLHWERRRLRNLVQLCRFDLPGLSRTDRLRIIRSYGCAMGDAAPRRILRRTVGMLRARRLRDNVGSGRGGLG